MTVKYFFEGYGHRIEITKEQFVKAERCHGFNPKYDSQKESPATGGFVAGDVRYLTAYVD